MDHRKLTSTVLLLVLAVFASMRVAEGVERPQSLLSTLPAVRDPAWQWVLDGSPYMRPHRKLLQGQRVCISAVSCKKRGKKCKFEKTCTEAVPIRG